MASTHQGTPGDGQRQAVDEHDHEDATGLRGRVLNLFRPHSHDSADSVDAALESSTEGIQAVKISLVALGITAGLQVIVVGLSGSVALLADTVHNFSDALTAVPLWIAFVLARRGRNSRYTYGYGRAEDLAGLFIVAMIALSAVLAAYQSVQRLISPQPLEHIWWVFAAGIIGAAGNEFVAVYRIRVGRRIGSAALVADGLHARTDGLTSVGVALGAAGVAAGFPLADPIVGLLISVAIIMVLVTAARDIFGRLLDRVDPALVDDIRARLSEVDGVEAVDSVRVRWIGNKLRAELEVSCDSSCTLVQAHAVADTAEHHLLHTIPRLAGANVHVSPADVQDTDYHRELSHHRGSITM